MAAAWRDPRYIEVRHPEASAELSLRADLRCGCALDRLAAAGLLPSLAVLALTGR